MILTVDVGTSATKVALWDLAGLVALSTSSLATGRPAPGRAEQDPLTWWPSVLSACAEVRAAAGDRWGSVEVVGCTGARQTFACVGGDGAPLGPAILWSDGRAVGEATALNGGSAPTTARRTGIVVDGGSVAAKLAWLATHDKESWGASRWILTPRDLVLWRLTGEVVTDLTMASRSGLYDLDGRLVPELAGTAGDRLPPVVEPGQVIGALSADSAAAIGLMAGTPVVIGPADRPAEVVGADAGPLWPMVSWGTTANVSVPVARLPEVRPEGIVLSRAADGGWLLEGGLSAAGSLLAWLGSLTGRPPEVLIDLAGSCPPGARGVTATPWLDGARAPWWRPEARVALIGLDSSHGPADLARAGHRGGGLGGQALSGHHRLGCPCDWLGGRCDAHTRRPGAGRRRGGRAGVAGRADRGHRPAGASPPFRPSRLCRHGPGGRTGCRPTRGARRSRPARRTRRAGSGGGRPLRRSAPSNGPGRSPGHGVGRPSAGLRRPR